MQVMVVAVVSYSLLQRIRKLYPRLGAMDLKIAAIAQPTTKLVIM